MSGSGPIPPCPLCAADGRTPAARQALLDLAYERSGPALCELVIDYLACGRCGTVSLHPLPATEDLDRYYAAATLEVPGRDQQAAARAVCASRLDLLGAAAGWEARTGDGPARRCLDVGAAGCLFAGMLHERLGLETWCLEPCPPPSAPPGVHLVPGTLAEPRGLGPDERFDLVTCFSVLEHVRDPGGFLDLLVRRLSPGGLLMLEVPSGELLARGFPCAYGQNIYPLHLHHFLGIGLAAALNTRGLAPVHLSDRLTAGYPLLAVIARLPAPEWPADLFRRQLSAQEAGAREAFARLEYAAAKADAAGRRILVWGAGVDVFEMIQAVDRPWPANCDLVDRNPDKVGKTLAGVPVGSCAEAVSGPYAAVFAGTRHGPLARAILEDAGKSFPDVVCLSLFAPQEPGRT